MQKAFDRSMFTRSMDIKTDRVDDGEDDGSDLNLSTAILECGFLYGQLTSDLI